MSQGSARLQPFGSLAPDALYIPRAADDLLMEALCAGECCYVLAPRQIGKSSLQCRTQRRLRLRGVPCATIDLTQLGVDQVSAEAWYRGLAHEVWYGLGLADDPKECWRQHQQLSPAHRFAQYLQEALPPGPVALLIDEIDVVLMLPPFARDDFLACLRACHNARTKAGLRLGLGLLGVIAQAELVRDAARTPLNTAREIALRDFSLAEAQAFLPALAGLSAPQRYLAEIFGWTCGHPYMTQRLCEALLQRGEGADAAEPAALVARLVAEVFLQRGRAHDHNLAHAERRVFDAALPQELRVQMLHTYQLLLGGQRVQSRGRDPAQEALRLAGMVAEREGPQGLYLAVRNRIFAQVFDERWVAARTTSRFFQEAMAAWLHGERREDFLLRGEALRRALAWAEGRDDLSREEQRFLQQGQQAEQRAGRRRLGGLGVLAVLATLVLVLLWRQTELRRQAEQEQRLIEMGASASLLAERPGQELEALRKGAAAAAAYLDHARTPPASVEAGLRAAVVAGRASLVLRGHDAPVVRVAFAPDSRTLLSLDHHGSVRLWDAAAGHGLLRLATGPGTVTCAAFSPDGQSVVTVDARGAAVLWDAHTGAARWRIALAPGALLWAAFSPDGAHIAISGLPAQAWLVAAASGRVLADLLGFHEKVTDLRYSADGRVLLGSSYAGQVQLWDGRTGARLRALEGAEAVLGIADLSPDGGLVGTAAPGGAVRIWDVASGALLRTLRGHSATLRVLRFSADGRTLLSGGGDRSARLWAPHTGRLLAELRNHQGAVVDAAFLPDGLRVVTAGTDHSAQISSLLTGERLATLAGHAESLRGVAVSADGTRVATASADHSVRLWSGASGSRLHVVRDSGIRIPHPSFSADGTLMTPSSDGSVRLWARGSGLPTRALALGASAVFAVAPVGAGGAYILVQSQDRTARLVDVQSGQVKYTIPKITAYAQSVDVAPDGTRALVQLPTLREAELRDLVTDRQIAVLRGHAATIDLQFFADGERALTSSSEEEARVWDGRSGALLQTLPGPTGPNPVLSPDGARLLTRGLDGTARVWDVGGARLLVALSGHRDKIGAVAFFPDGQRVLTISLDHTARIWEIPSGRVLLTLPDHGAPLHTGALSPDGDRIATVGVDRVARLSDARSGALLATLKGHEDVIIKALFSPHGDLLLTTSADGTILRWDGRSGSPIQPLDTEDLLRPILQDEPGAPRVDPPHAGRPPLRAELLRACRLLWAQLSDSVAFALPPLCRAAQSLSPR